MSPVVDATVEADRQGAVDQAAEAVRGGGVVVMPTDTVYGIGCDAFSEIGVESVLTAKGRGREMPLPVLVPDQRTLDGLATDIQPWVRDLVGALWPGPLTLVLTAQPSLHWDLGETRGTVAVRMPDDEIALAILRETGPMGVTSANLTGEPPARTVLDAASQLGGMVSVYVDGGPRRGAEPSTILDCTGDAPVVLRQGAVPRERIEEITGLTVGDPDGGASDDEADDPFAHTEADTPDPIPDRTTPTDRPDPSEDHR